MAYLTLVPAYGRDYKSAADVKAAWLQGKDFRIACVGHPDDGTYINRQDSKAGDTLNIRYKAHTRVCVLKGSQDTPDKPAKATAKPAKATGTGQLWDAFRQGADMPENSGGGC